MPRVARLALSAAIALAACGRDTTAPAGLRNPRRPLTEAMADTPAVGYLAAFMTSSDERGMYYALSTDGRHFESLNLGRAVLRSKLDDRLLRDPMLFRDRTGRYHLVATVSWTHRAIVMWDSYDLVTWSNERLIPTGPAASSKAWAPELVYDRQRDEYMLVFTADEGSWSTTAFYAMTTTNFRTFSAPTLLYRDTTVGVLDATFVADSDAYHMFFRANGMFQATAQDAMGPYTGVTLITPDLLEGPFVYRANDGSGWTLLLDNWQDNSGYTVMESPDLATWTALTNPLPPRYNATVSFPPGVRHGSVVRVSQAQIDTLLSAYGASR